MENTFTFGNGVMLAFSCGEDGYTVNITGTEEPLIGTFTDLEEMCLCLAPLVQQCGDMGEIYALAEYLDETFHSVYGAEELLDLMLK